MNAKRRAHIIALHRETPPRLRRSRSPCALALTRLHPSAIVRASPFAFRDAARIAHAPLAAHFAAPPAAFNSQARPLAH